MTGQRSKFITMVFKVRWIKKAAIATFFLTLSPLYKNCAPFTTGGDDLSLLGVSQYEKLHFQLFEPRCVSCHGDQKSENDIDLSTYDKVMASGTVIPFNAEGSLLYQSVASGSMPPDTRLDPDLILKLREWIDSGARRFDEGECVEETPARLSLPRLSNSEYEQIIRDILGDEMDVSWTKDLPDVPPIYGYDNNSQGLIDHQGAEFYLSIAESLTEQLLTSPKVTNYCSQQLHFGGMNWENCYFPILKNLGQKLYRRPLRKEEEASLRKIFVEVRKSAEDVIISSETPIRGHNGAISISHEINPSGPVVVATGWAFDPDWPLRHVEVHFYVRPTGTQVTLQFVGSTIADVPRSDVNNLTGAPGDHGYAFAIPKAYLNGRNYELYAYSIGTSTNQPLLSNPKTFGSVLPGVGLLPKLQFRTSTREGLKAAISSLLMSPNFLFKPEFTPDGFRSDEVPFAAASRLSFLVRGSFPDETLWSLAAEDRLTPTELKVQAERLIRLSSRRLTINFAGQWLEFRDTLKNDPDELSQSMAMESLLVFEELLKSEANLSQLMVPGFTFVNAPLSSHYQLGVAQGVATYKRIETTKRGGILNQGHFLSLHTGSPRAQPIKRGVTVLGRVLCRTLPTLNAATFEEIAEAQKSIDPNAPLIEQMKDHRDSSKRCYSCHSQIDPIGLALENWDNRGVFRTQYENGHPVVADLDFNGTKVSDPFELSEVIGQSPEFRTCVARQIAAFSRGLDPTGGSKCAPQPIEDQPLKGVLMQNLLEAAKGAP